MTVGVNNFDRLKEDALKWRPESAERVAWAQVFLSLLTQTSSLAAFPSYNVVLGFWGLYSVFTRSMQATLVYVWLLCLSILLDVIFCSIWGSNETGVFSGSAASFCLVVFILNILAKGAGVYTFLRLYKELEAGSIRPNATFASGAAGKREGGTGAGGGSAYNMAPLDSREHRGQIGSPTGSIFSAGSAASFALSTKGAGA